MSLPWRRQAHAASSTKGDDDPLLLAVTTSGVPPPMSLNLLSSVKDVQGGRPRILAKPLNTALQRSHVPVPEST